MCSRFSGPVRANALLSCRRSRNTWLACSYLPFSDGRGRRAVQSCRVQSEGVKNESKGLQETGLPAIAVGNW